MIDRLVMYIWHNLTLKRQIYIPLKISCYHILKLFKSQSEISFNKPNHLTPSAFLSTVYVWSTFLLACCQCFEAHCHSPHFSRQVPLAAVTGETGGGVASPQKSSELNKPPGKHKNCISFTVCLGAAPKELLLLLKKRRGSCCTMPLWQCANLLFQHLDLTIFYPSSSITGPVQTSSLSALLLICLL